MELKNSNEIKLALQSIKNKDYSTLKIIFSSFLKNKQFDQIKILTTHLIHSELETKKANIILSILKVLIKNKQQKIVKTLLKELKKVNNQYSIQIQNQIIPLNKTNDQNQENIINPIKVDTETLIKNNIIKTTSSTNQNFSTKKDITPNTKNKENFKTFYHSFIKDNIISLIVTCEKSSLLGEYYIKITKKEIDFRKIENNIDKKYIYNFKEETIKVGGHQMSPDYLTKFFNMMENVSKDVKSKTAQLYQETTD